MREIQPPEQHNDSGLDMKKTIKWYEDAKIEMPSIPEVDLSFPLESEELIELSSQELGGLLSLFPESARNRSILRKIVGKPTHWFHQDSTKEKNELTTIESEAISSTAIIPSYIDYTLWKELGVPTADIYLYKIPSELASKDIRKIILSEGFVHEVGHSIVQPALYSMDYSLKFPDGRIVDGFTSILQFAEMAENHPPISHYASNYRGDNNKFENKDPRTTKTAISEEMCETIAAYLLGFAYCGDDFRGKNPFADRAEIKDFIKDFLSAELVK